MYAASACLVLVLVIMGVSMINSFDRMKSVQDTLDTLAGTTDEVETRETSGSVTAVTEEQTKDGQAADSGQEEKTENEAGQNSTGHSDVATSAETTREENAAGAADTTADTENGSDSAAAQDSTSTDSTSSGENGSDGVYIVEEGDTLAIISKKMYGDVTHVDAICKMNGITDGNLIYVGQKLLLP